MFDVGFWELLILFGLGLVVLGPERLPKVAMQVGQWAGRARRMARTLSAQMRAELELDQTIGGSSYTPPPHAQTYSRPGVDELKTASGAADVPEPPVDTERAAAPEPPAAATDDRSGHDPAAADEPPPASGSAAGSTDTPAGDSSESRH